MIIKAFSFEQNSLKNAEIKREVTEALSEAGIFFESFSEVGSLFTGISSSLEEADAILIGVDTSMYLKFKPVLIKAFNFTPSYSEKIDAAIGSTIADEKVRKAHSLIPSEANELLSSDGLNSGFYVRSQEQYIVVFPLNSCIVPTVLEESPLPFFRSKVSDVSAFEDITSTETASSKASAIVTKLVRNDLRLAIPATPASKILKADIQNCNNYENSAFFTPFVNDDGVSDPKEYAAQLSKGAMELRSTDIGATISNIFRKKKGDEVISYYVFISVAVEEKIIVKKFYAEAGEQVDNLIVEATNELYSMIDKYLDEIISIRNMTDEEKEKYERSLIEAEFQSRPVAGVSKRGTIIAVTALLIAIAACIVLGFKFKDQLIGSNDKVTNGALQTTEGGFNFQTSAPDNSLPSSLSDLTIPSTSTTAPSTSTTKANEIFTPTPTAPTTQRPTVRYDTGDDRPTPPATTTTTERATTTTTESATTTTEPTEAPEAEVVDNNQASTSGFVF